MILVEFLSSPGKYKKFERVKKDICCHIAKSESEYKLLLDRFYELTSKKDNTGQIIGYRTRIIHMGTPLEKILTNEQDRNMLLLELQIYIGCVIEDMIKNINLTWENFNDYRSQLKIQLGGKA